MNHAHSSSLARRPLQSSKPSADNDLIVLDEALLFVGPVHLDFASGWEQGSVINWYNNQKAKGSIAINKIQLRKNYQKPFCHEYIVISTKGDHIYCIDPNPDTNTPFNMIMRAGCIAYDTITEVHSTNLKELHEMSNCVVELHWQGKQTIDLLFVLSICFAIQTNKWAKWYTLQSYNCYFLLWAIIVI